LTGIYAKDRKLANEALDHLGFTEEPFGFMWHHHESGEMMQLVPLDLHRAVRHTGGVAVIKSRSK
jgi:filamentous hemagglutinin